MSSMNSLSLINRHQYRCFTTLNDHGTSLVYLRHIHQWLILPADKFLAGVTLTAIRSLTVLHTCSHIPHPTQRSRSTTRRSAWKSMAKASTGHFDTQAWHPWPAVHDRCDTAARPIRTSKGSATGSKASVAQAAIQGKSSHSSQAT